jgi:hypothetical protein
MFAARSPPLLSMRRPMRRGFVCLVSEIVVVSSEEPVVTKSALLEGPVIEGASAGGCEPDVVGGETVVTRNFLPF